MSVPSVVAGACDGLRDQVERGRGWRAGRGEAALVTEPVERPFFFSTDFSAW
jgi:hypothetical protein